MLSRKVRQILGLDQCRTPAKAASQYYSSRNVIERRPKPGFRYFGRNLESNGTLAQDVIITAIGASAIETGSDTRVCSKGPAWRLLGPLAAYSDRAQAENGERLIRAMQLWDCGPGHIIQQLQFMLGIPIDKIPRGRLQCPGKTIPKRVALHMHLKQWGHACMPSVTDETLSTITKWQQERSDLSFVEVGYATPFSTVDQIIREVAQCEYYVGLPSGVMHLAVAFQKKCIVMVSRIHHDRIALPRRKNLGDPLLAWLYPQASHLTEHEESALVKSVTVDALNCGIAGTLYSYQDVDER